MRVLVAGSTGMVGGEVPRQLAARGDEVRGLVRGSADESKVAALRASGVTVVEGDLRDGQSLSAACQGVDAVVTTVSAMPFSWQEGNTIGDVDRDGTIRLIDAAKQAGVRRFVHTSFPHEPEPTYRLGEAKAAAERHLVRSGMEYAILAANYFTEVWLSPALGFDYTTGSVTIYGDGTNPMSWVSYVDVARTACEATSRPEARNATLPVGGPEALTPLDVVAIFEERSGRKWDVQHIPVESLQEQLAAADDEIQESIATLQIAYATAQAFRMRPEDYLLQTGLKSVPEYAEQVVAQSAGQSAGV